MSFHPRLSLSGVSTWSNSLDEDIALCADLGIDQVGLIMPKVDASNPDASGRAILDAGWRVSSVTGYPHEIPNGIELAPAIGAPIAYTPGAVAERGLYEESAARFRKDIAPLVARARELGLRFGMENTNPLQSFLYTVRDAVDLGRETGVDLVIDFNSAWYERDLAGLVRDNLDILALVQICDRKLDTTTMTSRVAIGDGDLPVEQLLGIVLESGYEGAFELEVLGPEIEAEGYGPPIVRSFERASEMLARLGA